MQSASRLAGHVAFRSGCRLTRSYPETACGKSRTEGSRRIVCRSSCRLVFFSHWI